MNQIPQELQKRIVKYSILIAIVAIFLIYFIFNYAFIYVHVTKPEGVSNAKVYLSYDLNYNEIGKPGLHVVKRGADGIMVKSGQNIRTVAKFQSPWYGFTYREIHLQRDKNADKIAFKSVLKRACGTYSKKLDRLAHYSCSSNPQALMYYNTPTKGQWLTETISSLYYPSNIPVSYMGGLIGVSSDEKSYLPNNELIRVVSDTGETRVFKWPTEDSAIDEKEDQNLPAFERLKQKRERDRSRVLAKIFTDTKNQNNNRFVLVSSRGDIYLATPHSDSINYKKVNAPDWYDTSNSQTICDINGAAVVCYRGLSDSPKGELSSKPTQSGITELSFNDNSQKEIKLENNLILQDFGVTSSGYIFGRNTGKLFYFSKGSDSKLHTIEISNKIDTLNIGDKAYFIQDKGVFVVDPKTLSSHQIFYSTNIIPERLTVADSHVFIIGKSAQRQKGYTYAWRINQHDHIGDKSRPIDMLPSFLESSTYGTVDLVEDSLYVQPPVYSINNPEDLARRQKVTLEYLRKSGIDTTKFNIVTP